MTDTPIEPTLDDAIEEAAVVDDLAADRPADGVDEERLSGYSVYDTAELRYVGTQDSTKRAVKADPLVKADPGRYVVRRV